MTIEARSSRIFHLWLPFAVGVAALSSGENQREPDRAFGNAVSGDEPRDVQLLRAEDGGRGREAFAPWRIPALGWRDIFWRTLSQISEDRLLAVAGGVVFYCILAVFPALASVISLYGLFADARSITAGLDLLSSVVPAETFALVKDEAMRIAARSDSTLSIGLIVGLATALWSANAGMKATIDALNVVYEETEKRSFLKLNLISMGFTVAAVVIATLVVAFVVALPLLLQRAGVVSAPELIVSIARWPLLLLLILGAITAIYRYGPSRRHARWQWLSVGGVLATLAWVAASALFSLYLSNFADYNATYGALGAIIGMMMWMWILVVVILVGAELNSEIEHQTAQDSTIGPPRPLGARGAVMADTVGEIP